MEKQRTMKTMTVIALICSVLGLSIAFAAMSQKLEIGGTGNMNPAGWDVKFTNVAKSETGGATGTDGTLASTSFTGASVTLTKPGDSVVYSLTIKNDGGIDAKVGSIVKTDPSCTGTESDGVLVCGNLVYKLTYANGDTITVGDKLASGNSVDVKFTIGYDGDTLPLNSVAISNLSLTLNYIQDNG